MTPAARTQAAIELLDTIIAAAREGGGAADTLIARYFATRRYAGSKDRRSIRELVYAAIRRAGERPASGRAAVALLADQDAALAASFDGSQHGPAPLLDDEPRAAPGAAPAWLIAELAASGIADDGLTALIARAPLDLRVNPLRGTVAEVREALPDATLIPGVEFGLRLPTGTVIEQSAPFRHGAIAVQDAGSQLVTSAAAASAGMQVVDLCAGAGGKTLALAAAMQGRGAILACEVDRARLARLRPRADRAGIGIVEERLLDAGREANALEDWRARADVVLVDAPCSGTGTWRRNPEARWRLAPARLERLVSLQRRVLEFAAPLVRPGGALVYIVCSLLDAEGPAQVERFLAAHPGWSGAHLQLGRGTPRGAGVRLTPQQDDTDGFFVARLVAPC